MPFNPTRPTVSRTGWAIYALVEIALFVTANLTAKTSSHPGTLSNVFFIAFIGGLAGALLLGAVELVRKRSATRQRSGR